MSGDSKPIFQQLADWLINGIATGMFAEGTALPSINEIAKFRQVNPATANRAVALLAEQGLAEKRRGLGMFVVVGAKNQVLESRKRTFPATHLSPAIAEAKLLGLTATDLTALIEKEWNR